MEKKNTKNFEFFFCLYLTNYYVEMHASIINLFFYFLSHKYLWFKLQIKKNYFVLKINLKQKHN